jgi:hypothetical protein
MTDLQDWELQDWELKAREQIRDLVARYNAYGDAGRLAEVLALFADDAVVEIIGHRSYRGRNEIGELFGGTASPQSGQAPNPGKAGRAPSPVWHHTSTLVIDVESPTLAAGRCYFAVLTPQGLDHWGRYRDRYAAVDEGWRFAARSVRVDGMVDGGWAQQNLRALGSLEAARSTSSDGR